MRRLVLLFVAVAIAVIVFALTRSSESPPASGIPAAIERTRTPEPVPAVELVDAASPQRVATQPAMPAASVPTALAVEPDLKVLGRVVDASRAGVADVEVAIPWVYIATTNGESMLHGTEDVPFARVRTQSDGSFEFGLSAPDGGRIANVLCLVSRRGSASVSRREGLREDDRELDLGELVLLPSATISGNVRDREHGSIAGAHISISVVRGPKSWSGTGRSYRSEAEGAFSIDDAPTGPVKLNASTEDSRTSDAVDVTLSEGEVRTGVELVMPVYEDPSAISGVVLDVDGTPLPKAPIAYSFMSGGGNTAADARGRFRLQGKDGAAFRVTASHPRDEARPVRLENVSPGRHDLVLQLTPHYPIVLLVNQPGGKPVERFSYRVDTMNGSFGQTGRTTESPADTPGQSRVPAPADSFTIAITARGFAEQRVGPFDPTQPPGSIEVVLQPVPGLRGRVVDGKEPVAGARVRAHAALAHGESMDSNGFDVVVGPCDGCAEATTWDDGAFLLYVPRAGVWHVRAEAAGRPATLSAPVEIAGGKNPSEIVIDMAPRGAIEGRVRGLNGAVLARRRIEASCGDGSISTATTDAEGRYRFDPLAPGGWQVRLVDESNRDRGGSSTQGPDAAPPIAWDCHVQNGATTRFDIGVTEPAVLLVRIDEGNPALPASDWRISADTHGLDVTHVYVESRATEDVRAFALSLPRPGAWRLVANLDRTGTRLFHTQVVTVVAGRNDHTFVVPNGSVVGRLRQPFSGGERVTLQVGSADRTFAMASVAVAADGTFTFPFAFAGSSTLVLDRDSKRLKTVTVTSGSSNDVGEL